MEWELLAFLPLPSPSTSRGVGPLGDAAGLPLRVPDPEEEDAAVVEVERGAEAEGREGREDASLARVLSSRRLGAILIAVSSAGGSICSISRSAEGSWKTGAEARREKGAVRFGAAFDEGGGWFEAGGADGGRGWDEEMGLLDGRGTESFSSSEMGISGSRTTASVVVCFFA